MRTDARLDLVRRLHQRDVRDSRREALIEGVRFVLSVDPRRVRAVVWSPKLVTSGPARRWVRARERDGVPLTRLTPEEFRSVSSARRASGVAAVIRAPIAELHATHARTHGPWLAVRTVRAPGNLGTLLRSAAAFGAEGLILLGGSVDPWDRDVIRASMGGIFRLTVARGDAPDLARWGQRQGISILAATPDADDLLGRRPLPRRVVFLLGDERRGVSAEDLRTCRGRVRIPMAPGTDSLNLAQAGTVLLYEAQRTRPPPRGATRGERRERRGR